ncbi:MAG: hypothetical protein WC595_00730 [Candidatus Nanoarchaeia archaeon]
MKKVTFPNEDSYEALKAKHALKPSSPLFGVISKETGDTLGKVIYQQRKQRNIAHQKRIKKIIKQLEE